jgi:hypothetical protein
MLRAALACAAALCANDAKYLVVVAREAEIGYQQAAANLAKLRGGEVVAWSGEFEELEKLLTQRKPRYLALVLPPGAVDANLPRRLVPMLTGFDADPFVDCAWGIVTGASGDEAKRFVDRIAKASRDDLPPREFSATSVVVDECTKIGPRRERGAIERELERTDLWVTGKDAKWRDFVERERDGAEKCGLVEWGHCGDSQGIWLFSMYRNREKGEHWPYDPKRVGEDRKGEMPRLTALDLVDDVDLFPAVVVNGSCHSGVTRRTMVGPDIVSTFGDTGGLVRFFDIAPEQSFTLMAIRRGATGYIAPLAANNANRAGIEMWWIERGGVALGEVVRRTCDELVFGSTEGKLDFALFEDGAVPPEEAPMFADCVQRVLFGDPAFVPWRDEVPTSHRVKASAIEGGLKVEVAWSRLAEDPWVWQPWREERAGDELGRIYERLALESFPGGEAKVTVVEAFARRGKEKKPLALTARALVERDLFDKPVLHLEALGARKEMDARGLAGGPEELLAVFEVRFVGPKTRGG